MGITTETTDTTTFKATVNLEDVYKVDVRICEVVAAERVPKKDKLLKLTINTGSDERTAITNVGGFYEPEQLVGKRYPFILNLEPKIIANIETAAMIVAISTRNGVELFETPAEVGSVVI